MGIPSFFLVFVLHKHCVRRVFGGGAERCTFNKSERLLHALFEKRIIICGPEKEFTSSTYRILTALYISNDIVPASGDPLGSLSLLFLLLRLLGKVTHPRTIYRVEKCNSRDLGLMRFVVSALHVGKIFFKLLIPREA